MVMIPQRLLGRTSLQVSELCLGTMNFGWKTDEAASLAILDAYRAAGGNFIQASSGAPQRLLPSTSTQFSEAVVGRWWRARGIPRHELVFATRISVRPAPGAGDDALAQAVREACHASLRRLKTTYLDVVFFEWSEHLLPWEAAFDAFTRLVRLGLVRYIGAANFPAWRVAEGLSRAFAGNHARMEGLQADYSLLTRARFESELGALCREHRLGFLARSPLAGGFLARENVTTALLRSLRRDWLVERFGNRYGETALLAVTDVAHRTGASPAQVALAWVLGHPGVTAAVVGVRSPAQLRELAGASSVQLDASDRQQLAAATASEEVRLGTELPVGAAARAPETRTGNVSAERAPAAEPFGLAL